MRPLVHRRNKRTTTILAGLMLALSALVACSNDDTTAVTTTIDTSEQYCEAWTALVSAFESYDEIDIVNGGLDSVRTYFDDLDTAAQELEEAADAQLKPAVDEFTGSLDELGTTLTSSSLPTDRRDEVRAAAAEVDSSWNDLVDAFEAGCPSVTAGTVDTTGPTG